VNPTTLDEAIEALDKLLTPEDREKLVHGPEDPHEMASALHHSLGRYLRNEWRLWHGSALAQHLKEVHNTDHPDDMTHVIVVAYCRKMVRTRFERL